MIFTFVFTLLFLNELHASEPTSFATSAQASQDEWAYRETLELCEQVPIILPDLQSINPRDTTTLLSLKPFIEGFRSAARKGRIIQSSEWLEAVTSSPGFDRALDECYATSDAAETRRQFIAKLYMYEAVGKIAAAATLGLALEPLHEYIAEVIETAQWSLNESLEKLSPLHN